MNATYQYCTDSESGSIEAESLQAALNAIAQDHGIDQESIANGAFAWARDENGRKLSIAPGNEF